MLKRRDFIRSTGAFTMGAMFMPFKENSFFGSSPIDKPGLQLFTFFGVIEKDVPGTLKKIADSGYKELESAFSSLGGYYGLKPKEFAALVKNNGLSWQSHHVLGTPFKLPAGAKMPNGADGKPMKMPVMRNLKENMQELVDEAAEGGVNYLVCANISHGTGDEIKQAVEVLSKTGEACKKAKITFAYHNHESEFREVEGQIPYQVFLSQIDADLLKMELDLGWAIHSGNDPIKLFKKHPGRFPLWHVKDISKETSKPVEIGAGYIDFKPIFANASTAGMKHFFIEQDGAPKPFENIAASLTNLKKMLA
jgi:sugar phosphate isomerase/epimerase